MARNQSIRRKKEQRGVWFADVTTTNYLPVIFLPSVSHRLSRPLRLLCANRGHVPPCRAPPHPPPFHTGNRKTA